MKTIMDAVNELEGDLKNLVYPRNHNSSESLFKFVGANEIYATLSSAHSVSTNDSCEYYCSVADINFLMLELSHASWIKGASLAEYQAADKEVLKVESKTVEVEVDGELYQLEKDYEFKNCGDKYWVNGCLDNVRRDSELRFASNGFWWKCCRVVDNGNLGTITPAPVKLVDGAAYEVTCLIGRFCGIYNKDDAMFCISPDRRVSFDNAEDITRLVPEVK